VAKEYEEKWQFPNLLGAVDGKHIRIKAPVNLNPYILIIRTILA